MKGSRSISWHMRRQKEFLIIVSYDKPCRESIRYQLHCFHIPFIFLPYFPYHLLLSLSTLLPQGVSITTPIYQNDTASEMFYMIARTNLKAWMLFQIIFSERLSDQNPTQKTHTFTQSYRFDPNLPSASPQLAT